MEEGRHGSGEADRAEQREGMGLYQSTRPCLPCVRQLKADCCVHLLCNSRWKFHQLAAGQLMLGQPVRYGKGRRHGPSITYKITSAASLSSSQPGGPPCWTSPLAFGLIRANDGYSGAYVFFCTYVVMTDNLGMMFFLYVCGNDGQSAGADVILCTYKGTYAGFTTFHTRGNFC
jgi:hypothetical protein